jgi:hypothetical protein
LASRAKRPRLRGATLKSTPTGMDKGLTLAGNMRVGAACRYGSRRPGAYPHQILISRNLSNACQPDDGNVHAPGCQSHASRRISRAREFALPRSSDDVDNTISRITPIAGASGGVHARLGRQPTKTVFLDAARPMTAPASCSHPPTSALPFTIPRRITGV